MKRNSANLRFKHNSIFKSKIFLLIVIIILVNYQILLAQQLAFPGAEGWGRHTKGGRGGAVYEVTNLNDSGPGSLREAVKAIGPRTVVFRISGTIRLLSDLEIIQPYITIAGQTAPGDGICLRDHAVEVSANHVILRYLRFRLGDESKQESDSIWGRYRRNIIIDHCSVSWSVDEALSFYGNDSLTIQWCLISESLYMSVHSQGAHGYGGIWGGRNSTFHHNLLAHHSSRTPRFSGGETTPCENVDFRNNVIYNWGFNSAYGGESGKINMVANYFKTGPATKSGVKYRIIQPSDKIGKWHIEDNFVEGSPEISANNWAGGVQGSNAVEAQIRAYSPFAFDSILTQTPQEAYDAVLKNVGANFPKRDVIDERIICDVRSGIATHDGYFYEINQGFSDTSIARGIIDSQSDVGSWPDLISLAAPDDADHDGMPDEWEFLNGLNSNDPADRNLLNSDGYTMLETYLNSLVSQSPSAIKQHDDLPSNFILRQNYPNPFNQGTTISYSIPMTGIVNIKIYSLNGKTVRNLMSNAQPSGSFSIYWNGRDDQNRTIASGLYFCAMNFKGLMKTMKMYLIK